MKQPSPHPRLASLRDEVETIFDAEELKEFSPTLHLRSHLLDDQALHNRWTALFADNKETHKDLPILEEAGIDPLYSKEDLLSKEFTPASTIRCRA